MRDGGAGALVHGIGVECDEAEAVRLFRESSEKGDSDGSFYLARCAAEGRGMAASAEEALLLCEKALADNDFCNVKPAEVRRLLKKLRSA